MKTQAQMIAILKEAFPKGNFVDSAEFSGSKGGIWIRGDFEIDGEPAVDGWADSYEFGAHPKLAALCKAHGWFCEPHDPGTMMIWS